MAIKNVVTIISLMALLLACASMNSRENSPECQSLKNSYANLGLDINIFRDTGTSYRAIKQILEGDNGYQIKFDINATIQNRSEDLVNSKISSMKGYAQAVCGESGQMISSDGGWGTNTGPAVTKEVLTGLSEQKIILDQWKRIANSQSFEQVFEVVDNLTFSSQKGLLKEQAARNRKAELAQRLAFHLHAISRLPYFEGTLKQHLTGVEFVMPPKTAKERTTLIDNYRNKQRTFLALDNSEEDIIEQAFPHTTDPFFAYISDENFESSIKRLLVGSSGINKASIVSNRQSVLSNMLLCLADYTAEKSSGATINLKLKLDLKSLAKPSFFTPTKKYTE